MVVDACQLTKEAATVVRRAIEKDINGRRWLKPGYVIFVREILEPGVEILIEDIGSAVNGCDGFPVHLQVEWSDLNERGLRNRLVAQVGAERAARALAGEAPRQQGVTPSGLHNRLLGLFK